MSVKFICDGCGAELPAFINHMGDPLKRGPRGCDSHGRRMAEASRVAMTNATRPPVLSRPHPRGTIRVTDTMRACYRQWSEGAPRATLATLYGVSRQAISKWIKDVHEADKDARAMGSSQ